jgi:hypothetical protein
MAKGDNPYMVLMTNCNVKLECDGEKIDLKYRQTEEHKYGVWFMNGENTGLQVTSLWKQLKEKYNSIKVVYKKQF